MTARVLDGTATARAIREELRPRVAALAARGVTPGLGVLLVGDDPASAVYVRSKTRTADDLRLRHEPVRLPASASTSEVAAAAAAYHARPHGHGILLQPPRPPPGDPPPVPRPADPATH